MTSSRTDQALANIMGALPVQGDTVKTSISTSAATTASALTAGRTYDMVSDVDCYVCATTAAADDATTSDYFLPSLTIVPITLDGSNLYVSGITASGSGSLFLSPRRAVAITR